MLILTAEFYKMPESAQALVQHLLENDDDGLDPIAQKIFSLGAEDVEAALDKTQIVDSEDMTPAMRRYWRKLARSYTRKDHPQRVAYVDPWRHSIKELRKRYPPGTRIYRASTGGKWGKSADIIKT